jgi:hypothetical protein
MRWGPVPRAPAPARVGFMATLATARSQAIGVCEVFRYIVRRILITIPLLIVGSFLVFALVQGMGDPLGEWKLQKPREPDEIALAYERIGYNDPFLERYANWVGGFVQGSSRVTGERPSFPEPASRTSRTRSSTVCGQLSGW